MLTSLAKPMLGMPRTAKRLLALSVDASLCVLTTWLAFYLRLDDWVLLSGRPLWAAVASMAIALPIFIVSGLYRAIFRYSGLPAMIAVLKAIVIYGLVYSAIFTAVGVNGIPRTVGLIQPILLLLTVGSSRVIARYWLGGCTVASCNAMLCARRLSTARVRPAASSQPPWPMVLKCGWWVSWTMTNVFMAGS